MKDSNGNPAVPLFAGRGVGVNSLYRRACPNSLFVYILIKRVFFYLNPSYFVKTNARYFF